MNYPIVELIRQNIVDTLNGVTKDSGYRVDIIGEASMEDGDSNRPRQGLAVVSQGEPEALDASIGHDAWDQPFSITIIALTSETAGTANEETINEYIAAAIKVLKNDRTRGGYAVDTRFNPPRIHDNRQGVDLVIRIHYRTLIDDPFNQ